jgi:hypothetical protein
MHVGRVIAPPSVTLEGILDHTSIRKKPVWADYVSTKIKQDISQ